MKAFRIGFALCWLVLGLPAISPAEVPDAEPASSSRLRLDSIRDDLVGLRFEQALSAIEGFLGRPDLSLSDRADALVLRSQAHVAFGDLKAAEQDYREILSMRPRFVPDASLTPRKAVERFSRVRATLIGDLTVVLQPAEARVTFDGRDFTIAPDGTVPLLAGEHLVRAELEGFDSLQQTIEVEANRESRIELRLVPNARTVVLLTQPDGVDVTLDGVWIGHTSRPPGTGFPGTALKPAELRIENLGLGQHVFELSKPCYRTETFRDLLTVDLLDWSTKRYEPVVLARVHSTVVLGGGPPGADVIVDGQHRGRLPLAPFGVCPGERRFEVRLGGRRVWAGVGTMGESEEWVRTVEPRPNVVLVGAESWPPELLSYETAFNTTIEDDSPRDPFSAESWSEWAGRLPPDTDLAIARGSGSTEATNGWVVYSPILKAVVPLEPGRVAVGRPSWTGVTWGLFVADSELGGPALVVDAAADHPASRAGLGAGDRLVSLGGTQVASSAQVQRILEVASSKAPLDVEWLSPDGTAHRGQLNGKETIRLMPGRGDSAADLVRSAWAVVDAACNPAVSEAARANLALLLSNFGRYELAARAWKRVSLPERAGIGRGTVQYYLGQALERTGREREAVRAHQAAASSRGTAFDDEGPTVAPAARDRLADLGVAD
jgi:hypothetical protein